MLEYYRIIGEAGIGGSFPSGSGIVVDFMYNWVLQSNKIKNQD